MMDSTVVVRYGKKQASAEVSYNPYVDAPGWASRIGKRVGGGQVLSYVRPLDAALVGRGPVWCS